MTTASLHPSQPTAPTSPSLHGGWVAAEAQDLLGQLAADGHLQAGAAAQRVAEIKDEVAATGSYRHTAEELLLGARIAWRNNPQCVGKFYWKALDVRDCRDIGRGGELCLMNPGASNAISTTTLIRRRWSPRRLPRRRQTLMSSPRPHCSRAYESPFSLRCDLIHVLRTLGRPGSVGPPRHPLTRLQTTQRVSETPMEYLAIRCR